MNRRTYPRWSTITLVAITVSWLIAVPALFAARFGATGVRGGQPQVEAPYDLWIAAIAVGLPCLAVLVAGMTGRWIPCAAFGVIAIGLAVPCIRFAANAEEALQLRTCVMHSYSNCGTLGGTRSGASGHLVAADRFITRFRLVSPPGP
jgi:hypothetical protein